MRRIIIRNGKKYIVNVPDYPDHSDYGWLGNTGGPSGSVTSSPSSSGFVTSSFGDTFESYPIGSITSLSVGSPVFVDSSGLITNNWIGIKAIENIDAYTSGSSPTLDSGIGWTGPGVIN